MTTYVLVDAESEAKSAKLNEPLDHGTVGGRWELRVPKCGMLLMLYYVEFREAVAVV